MPKLLIFYHFFHPDDVVSARLYSDFADEQSRRGWEVMVVTSNRACHDPRVVFPAAEVWRGVEVRRQFRPPWPQARAFPRLGNSAFLMGGWTLQSLRIPDVDAIVVGSDPAFAALLAIPLRRLRPRTSIFHWCFDLYPEAIEAEGLGRVPSFSPAARRLMGLAYRCCDVLVDIGPAMRARLASYNPSALQETLTPWALAESSGTPTVVDISVRRALFGDADLGLLYAGTMGRAHDFALLLELARACRARSGRHISFCFACRGNRATELRGAVSAVDDNVKFVPFASEEALSARLTAADAHLVSLRHEWAGIVVPSKFFASLAMGRPVVYAGPRESEIASWIAELGVGLHLESAADIPPIVERLHELAASPQRLARWQAQARTAYFQNFSRQIINDRWDRLLRDCIEARRHVSGPLSPRALNVRGGHV